MELIDKKQILYMIDTKNRVIALKNEIDDIPIIEAIPIKYLEHLADILDSDETGDWTPEAVIRLIIDAWKECNGNKGSD